MDSRYFKYFWFNNVETITDSTVYNEIRRLVMEKELSIQQGKKINAIQDMALSKALTAEVYYINNKFRKIIMNVIKKQFNHDMKFNKERYIQVFSDKGDKIILAYHGRLNKDEDILRLCLNTQYEYNFGNINFKDPNRYYKLRGTLINFWCQYD